MPYFSFSLKNRIYKKTFSNLNDILNDLEIIYKKRTETQPVNSFSAGCVFKNPLPENPAGKLIDMCGLKGYSIGGMKISEKHANFLMSD